MSNSPLVSYTKISPNRTSPRNHAIDTISIHCVVGQVTVERLGDIFTPTSKQASSNYGVGKDGKIGMYVEECDRSWCTSSRDNDNRAVTIEVASDATAPYRVTDAAYAALIELVADICKRNGIKKLVWSTNKTERMNHMNGCNMTVHRDYANKSCPGDYLYNLHGDIADKVNAKLGVVTHYATATVDTNAAVNTGVVKTVSTGLPQIKKGSYGPAIRALQILLIGNGYSCGSAGPDGDFGTDTDSAVRKFQKDKGLYQDGIVGHDTWCALLGV